MRRTKLDNICHFYSHAVIRVKVIAHWVWNFRPKCFACWKINTTSCYVNHVYTLSSIFFASVASILRGVLTVQSHRTSEWRLSSSSTSSRTHSHLIKYFSNLRNAVTFSTSSVPAEAKAFIKLLKYFIRWVLGSYLSDCNVYNFF